MSRIEEFHNDDKAYNATNFTINQLYELVCLFGLDDNIKVDGVVPTWNYNFHGEELLVFLLIKMKHGLTTSVMCDHIVFGCSTRWSYGYRFIVSYLIGRYKGILSLNSIANLREKVLDFANNICCFTERPQNLSDIQNTADVVQYPGAVYGDDKTFRIFGFFDCKTFVCCRPMSGPGNDAHGQREGNYFANRAFYGGHKQVHGLKILTIMLPNGMNYVLNTVSVRRNDCYVTTICRADEILVDLNVQALSIQDPNNYMIIYGDGGFRGYHNCLRTAHVGSPMFPLTADEKIQNQVLKSARQTIEQSYGKLSMLWKMETSGKRSFKLENGIEHVRKQVQLMYLLTNCHNCYKGSVVSTAFECLPPTIENYLAGIH